MPKHLAYLLDTAGLTGTEFAICVMVIFVAGMVRGFSGFALSALVMASLVLFIPPIELIVICWFLEMSASLLMVRGGVKQANWKVVIGLVVGSAIGGPIGLYLTNTLPVETSKAIALIVILALAFLQLLKVRATFLATNSGLYAAGILAGTVSGLASVGGMVVALYVLARDAPPPVMRASLVLFLFGSSLSSLIYLYLYGMLTPRAVTRGLAWIPFCMAGVLAGQALFRPRLQPYYRPFCLGLLIFLAAIGLMRMAIA